MTTLADTTLDLAQRGFKWADLEARQRLDFYRRERFERSTLWTELDITDWLAYVRTQAREALAARRRAKQWLLEREGAA
jgi:hypothetical protein